MKFYPLSHNKGRKCPYGHLVTVFRPRTTDTPLVVRRTDLRSRLGSEWRTIIAAYKLGVSNEAYKLALEDSFDSSSKIGRHLLLIQTHIPCRILDVEPYVCRLTDVEFQGHLA